MIHPLPPWGGKKGEVFYGQEPPSGKSTTTECGFNYQLLAVIYRSSEMRELLVAVDHNELRTIASEMVDPIDWLHPPPYTGQYPLSSTYCTVQRALQITRLVALNELRTCDLRHVRPTHCLSGHSGYKAKKASTIQYGYTKYETHARVFFKTLPHGNSKNEKLAETEEVGKMRRVNMERGTTGTKRSPDCATVTWVYRNLGLMYY